MLNLNKFYTFNYTPKNNSMQRTFLVKKITYDVLLKRFYPGHADKILTILKSKSPKLPVTPIVPKPQSSVSPIANAVTNRTTPKVNPETTMDVYDKSIHKENLNKFESIRDKVSLPQKNNIFSQGIQKDAWDIFNTEIITLIIRNTIPTLKELEIISKTLDTLGSFQNYKTIQTKILKQFLESKKIILKEYPAVPITNDPQIKNLITKSIKDPSYNIIQEDFFKHEFLKDCRTEEDFNHNIILLSKVLNTLQEYPNIPQEIFLLITNRLELITYPDATYYKDKEFTINNDNKTMVIKKGEGLKLDNKIYKTIATKAEFKNLTNESHANPIQLLDAVMNNQILGGIIISDPSSDTIALSGPDLHVILAINDFSNPEMLFVFAMLTSTKDDNTRILSSKQLDLFKDTNVNYQKLHPKHNDNDDVTYFPKDPNYIVKDINKPQRIRFNTNIFHLPKKNFEELPKATEYLSDPEVRNKLLVEMLPFAKIFCNAPYEIPLEFTQKKLVSIVTKYIEDDLVKHKNALQQYLTDLSKQSKDQRENKLKLAKSQRNNQLKENKEKAYKESLSQEEQLLIKIYEKMKRIDEKRINAEKAKRNREAAEIKK